MTQSLLDRFEQTILPLLDDAYTFARHLLRDEHDAQDAVQEAYLRAWRHFGGFLGGDPRAWLLTIVRHCCYASRRGGRKAEHVAYDDEQHTIESGSGYAADARAIGASERENL
ncbi:MAG TPA: sigma factor, partial [Gemmatimonadaceae bacterium]|nr:sigma factor [Gemmatimonadaceae bacterium]